MPERMHSSYAIAMARKPWQAWRLHSLVFRDQWAVAVPTSQVNKQIPRVSLLTTRKINRVEIPSLLKAKRKVTIVSKITKKPDTIYVISSREVHDNFISRNVIRRFGFGTRFDAGTVSSVIWDSKRHTSNGDFVDLSFPLPGSSESVAQRLLVLDKPPFDMLLGGSAGSISFVQKQKSLLQ